MTKPATLLKRLERLRAQHTANAAAPRWQANDTVSRRIRETWAHWHVLPDSAKQEPTLRAWAARL